MRHVIRYAKPIALAGLPDAPTIQQIADRVQSPTTPKPSPISTNGASYDRDGPPGRHRGRHRRPWSPCATTPTATSSNAMPLPRPSSWRRTAASLVPPSGQAFTERTWYDALNRARFTLDGGGSMVELRYDANSNLLEQRAYATAVAPATLLADRPLGEVSALFTPLADPLHDLRTRYVYDTAGRETLRIDATGAA